MRKNFYFQITILIFIFFVCNSLPAFTGTVSAAGGVTGRSYYMLPFDVTGTSLQPFTCTFVEGGTMTINMEGKTFENASGTYVNMGKTFYGSWEATETKESTSVTYSFLFVGAALEKKIAGIIYSTIMDSNAGEEDSVDGAGPKSVVIPFLGIVVDVALEETGTIKGKVTDAETSAPIPFALVKTDKGEYTTRTSVLGEYTLSYVEAGTYSMTVSAPGYEPALQEDITVEVDETTTADFSLSREGQ